MTDYLMSESASRFLDFILVVDPYLLLVVSTNELSFDCWIATDPVYDSTSILVAFEI